MGLNGQVAIVTGASSGIGRATALGLARAGCRVVLAARRQAQLEQVAREISALGGESLVIVTDVRSESMVERMVGRALERFNRLDILVNNAGLGWFDTIADGRTEEWREMIDTNLLGLLFSTRAALAHMLRQRSGHIVNISSLVGRRILPGVGVYSATKAAVIAISEALRQEVYQYNIRVTVIEPGVVETELTSRIPGEAMVGIKPLAAEDVAEAVVWAVTRPANIDVSEILLRPTSQGY